MDRVITLRERPRAQVKRPTEAPRLEVRDLKRLLDRHPPEGITLTPCLPECGKCDAVIDLRLFHRHPEIPVRLLPWFPIDVRYFQRMLRSGISRRQALFDFRDSVMRSDEVEKMLSDIHLARNSIVSKVHQLCAEVAHFACFPPRRPRCGVSDARCAA
jgi:hypothetical protein